MSRHFAALLLLDRVVELDVTELARAVRQAYPQIGDVDGIPGQGRSGDSGLIRIDGGNVVISITPGSMRAHQFSPKLHVMRAWDPAAAVARHEAGMTISCGGSLKGLEGAKAYAAAVHFVAAALVNVVPTLAVFWQRGYALTDPVDFQDSTRSLLSGRMPLGAWVSFASIVPRGYTPLSAQGMVTYGMKPFIGREIELAPRPGTVRSAHDCISAMARDTLDRGNLPVDGQRLLSQAGGGFPMTVRERTYWLRRDRSAFVLVSDDAVIDPVTLKPLTRPAA